MVTHDTIRDVARSKKKIPGGFPSRLNAAMEAKNISAAELAARSGVDATTISRYLSGGRKKVQLEKVTALARALAVSADSLWSDGTDAPFEDLVQADLDTSREINLESGRDIELIIARCGEELAALAPDEAAVVLAQLRQEHFKSSEPLPGQYWVGRMKRLIAEAEGRAKEARRRPAEVVDTTQESPEVRAVRKRPKRT